MCPATLRRSRRVLTLTQEIEAAHDFFGLARRHIQRPQSREHEVLRRFELAHVGAPGLVRLDQ
jgi:hypothetical protein